MRFVGFFSRPARESRREAPRHHVILSEVEGSDINNGINGKGQLIKSFAGPTGNVLAEKLPVGAVCPRKLAY